MIYAHGFLLRCKLVSSENFMVPRAFNIVLLSFSLPPLIFMLKLSYMFATLKTKLGNCDEISDAAAQYDALHLYSPF